MQLLNLIMTDDANIPVVRNQKEQVVEKFGWLSNKSLNSS